MTRSVLGPDIGRKTVRVVLALAGLLILRAILASLPMLKNLSAIDDSLVSPLVIVKAVVDTIIFLVLIGFGVGVGRTIRSNYSRLPDLGGMLSLATMAVVLVLAYKAYQVPAACLFVSPSDLTNLARGTPSPNVEELVRSLGGMFGGIANMEVKMANGDTLALFQNAAVVVLRQPPDWYGWIFLLLIAMPVAGIIVSVSRNLDGLTEMVFRAAKAPGAPATTLSAAAGAGPAGYAPRSATSADGNSPADAAAKLTKLRVLAGEGVITGEDFETQKAAILKRSGAPTGPEDLHRLKELADEGILTKEEYETQKQRFLASL
jgi:Short C-terminal domain